MFLNLATRPDFTRNHDFVCCSGLSELPSALVSAQWFGHAVATRIEEQQISSARNTEIALGTIEARLKHGTRHINELTAHDKHSFCRLYSGSWSAQMVGPLVRTRKLLNLHVNRTETGTVGLLAQQRCLLRYLRA
jgi:hypothetical protein